jgi:hypothetical protein
MEKKMLSHTSGITNCAVTRDFYELVKGFPPGNTVDKAKGDINDL